VWALVGWLFLVLRVSMRSGTEGRLFGSTHCLVSRMMGGSIVARGSLPSTSKDNTLFSPITASMSLEAKKSVTRRRAKEIGGGLPCKSLDGCAFNNHNAPLIPLSAGECNIRLHRMWQHWRIAIAVLLPYPSTKPNNPNTLFDNRD